MDSSGVCGGASGDADSGSGGSSILVIGGSPEDDDFDMQQPIIAFGLRYDSEVKKRWSVKWPLTDVCLTLFKSTASWAL